MDTFVSSTFKVEEIKVCLEFLFSHYKVDILLLNYFYDKYNFQIQTAPAKHNFVLIFVFNGSYLMGYKSNLKS